MRVEETSEETKVSEVGLLAMCSCSTASLVIEAEAEEAVAGADVTGKYNGITWPLHNHDFSSLQGQD